jgi:hypothetical protein
MKKIKIPKLPNKKLPSLKIRKINPAAGLLSGLFVLNTRNKPIGAGRGGKHYSKGSHYSGFIY